MSQTVIPRPIAWVVTENNGIINIAPFSYFIALSSEPPTLLVSVGHKKDGSPKDTLHNTLETGKATICITPPDLVEKMFDTSQPLPYDESEADKFNIKTQKLLNEFPPMVQGVPVAYFCNFFQKIEIGGTTIPLIYKIESVFLDDKIITDNERMHIDFTAVGRIGKKFALEYKTIEL
jgi:flavin reductase (DIM6/NTAB) family NADH-FMN oxidoreductase RutF